MFRFNSFCVFRKLLYKIVILQLDLLNNGWIYNLAFSLLMDMHYDNDNLL